VYLHWELNYNRINCVEEEESPEEEEISSSYITIEKSKRDFQRRERGRKKNKEDKEKGDEKGESEVAQSEGSIMHPSLTSLLEEASAETLKEILIQHSKDYRSSMLSCVEGNIQWTISIFSPTWSDTLRKLRTKRHLAQEEIFKAREWNEELQSLLKQGILGLEPHTVSKLNKLCHDFANCAERYAKYVRPQEIR